VAQISAETARLAAASAMASFESGLWDNGRILVQALPSDKSAQRQIDPRHRRHRILRPALRAHGARALPAAAPHRLLARRAQAVRDAAAVRRALHALF